MHQQYMTGESCALAGRVAEAAMPCGVVAAGEVCSGNVCDFPIRPSCAPEEPLAMAYVPAQVYCLGFCPAQALAQGTLFPELVSRWQRRNCDEV